MKRKDIRKLVVEMALANLGWGYTKIRDALRTGLNIEIGRTTVADILAEEGIFGWKQLTVPPMLWM